jgi:hypothetical protein
MRYNKDIKERASDKAFAKLLQVSGNIYSLSRDISLGRYGGVSKEEMEICLKSEKIERTVWEYITFLIENDNK